MPDEEPAEYLFEGSGEHYHVSLPMPPRASTRPTPPARTGANPMRPSAAPVRPVPSRRAPAEPAPTHTQELNGTRGRKTDEQHVVLKNLVEIRQKFERNIKPQIQAMFVDSTLSRTQARKGCEVFREMLIDQVVDPCRAAVCSDKLVGLSTTDAARATQLQEALIQDVKPWLFQLDQYIADLLAPESSFEKLDGNSGSESEVGGVEDADGKRTQRRAGTAAFDDGEHEPYGEPPPRYREVLRRSQAGMHTSQEEVSTNSKPRKRSGILDLRDIQYMRPNTRYANSNSGTLASRRNRAASGEGESDTGPSRPREDSDADDYIKPHSVASAMGYHRMSAGPKHDGELTRPKHKANVAFRMETPARSIHASLLSSTSHKATQPYQRRTPASLSPEVPGSPPAYSPSQEYSARNVQTSSRSRQATVESDDNDGGSGDTTAELQRAFRRLSTGQHKPLDKRSGGEVFEGRGQRRR
ncbi:hypothetical protein LTR70_000375 [Exophiala xenobiotica]|uniref:Uncharacterized protein n=1 Tax=Lithohypha guttulata TaxID=1690604 RepID=A0ABR0KPQ1_9EURO|nr:hypothetical protein LTR24_000076 [Lithohypha guttulata]KAK5330545.1 hypothetical protein LTR70_000375 [Exophiala xenobiotica]